MTEPDFAMGTSLVAGTARGLAPLPAFLLGAEAVPLLWVGDGKVASPSLEGGQVAVLRLHAASTGHVTKAAYSCVRGMYVRCDTKCRKLRTQWLTWSMFCTSPSRSERIPPSISTGPASHIPDWHTLILKYSSGVS